MKASSADRSSAAEASAHVHVPQRSIRASLAALVMACLVPAVAALLVMAYANYQVQKDALSTEAISRARTMMSLIERDLEGVESGLRVLATSDALATDDFARLHALLQNAQRSQIVRNYVLVGRDGNQRLNTLLAYGEPLPKRAARSMLDPVFAKGTPLLTGIFAAPSDKAPIVALAIPIFRGNEVAYALAAVITPDRIIAAPRQSLPEGWIAAVVDGSGRIAARTRDAERLVGQAATPSMISAIAGKAEGTTETITKDGVTVLTAFSHSATTDWTVAVGVPKAMVVASLYRSIGLLLAGASLALAIVLWLAFHLSRVVTQAVCSLVEPALALGNGKPVDLRPTRFRETDAVGRAIRQASQMLATARHHAYHDPLTNLCTRTLFDELVSRQLAQSHRDGTGFVLLAIDLDGFKAVNDRHGHAAGDLVLKHVAERITQVLRASDVVSRRGGDEFSVLLVDVDGVHARTVADKLLAALSLPYPDVLAVLSASIGAAVYPNDGTTLHELLERADRALYEAKNAGKGRAAGAL